MAGVPKIDVPVSVRVGQNISAWSPDMAGKLADPLVGLSSSSSYADLMAARRSIAFAIVRLESEDDNKRDEDRYRTLKEAADQIDVWATFAQMDPPKPTEDPIPVGVNTPLKRIRLEPFNRRGEGVVVPPLNPKQQYRDPSGEWEWDCQAGSNGLWVRRVDGTSNPPDWSPNDTAYTVRYFGLERHPEPHTVVGAVGILSPVKEPPRTVWGPVEDGEPAEGVASIPEPGDPGPTTEDKRATLAGIENEIATFEGMYGNTGVFISGRMKQRYDGLKARAEVLRREIADDEAPQSADEIPPEPVDLETERAKLAATIDRLDVRLKAERKRMPVNATLVGELELERAGAVDRLAYVTAKIDHRKKKKPTRGPSVDAYGGSTCQPHLDVNQPSGRLYVANSDGTLDAVDEFALAVRKVFDAVAAVPSTWSIEKTEDGFEILVDNPTK